MNMPLSTVGDILWLTGIVTWYVIRFPFERRARRVHVVENRRTLIDTFGLAAALVGQGIVPGIYVLTGKPTGADYQAHAWAIVLGAFLFFSGLWLFRRTHKELGKNWSISLEIREKHRLVNSGPYSLVRHPMYSAFLLLALGQILLLSNWVVGLAGILGFSFLFFLRVGKEEQMMLETFGSGYSEYIKTTKRVIPYLY
jgi:protein-S-isoprenylcysteine O-methyltransferase Ste14